LFLSSQSPRRRGTEDLEANLYWTIRMVQFYASWQTTFPTGASVHGWADLYAWQLDRASRTPLSRQIYMQVRSAVLSGALSAGARVPSSRAMAVRLGVARASVVAAYEQLIAEGYVESRHGSGTFISADVAGLAPRRRAVRAIRRAVPMTAKAFPDFERSAVQGEARPFNTGRTLIDARTAETWRTLTHRAVRQLGPNDLGYADPAGLAELRANICDYLRAARAVRCESEQIVITAGTQQAIDIAIRVLLAPGDEVWVEDPGYPLTHAQLLLAKARPHAIPVDDQGLIVDVARRRAPRARAVFVTPSHQFPSGVAMSMARRLELLAWARQSGAFIVEDDYTSEFRYSGPPLASLQGLDEAEQVIYVGTFNKALFPGLRIGYAVVPRALLQAFISARYLIDRQPATLQQTVVSEFMQQGHFAAHIRRMRQLYREQRDALAETLIRRAAGRLDAALPDQGMHLVAYLPDGTSDTEIEAAARRAGIVVRAISRFYRSARPRPGLMLGFSGFPRQLIMPAAARLARLVVDCDRR
jgi:GntR family transcriptional regulator/MocR family aminotransferase